METTAAEHIEWLMGEGSLDELDPFERLGIQVPTSVYEITNRKNRLMRVAKPKDAPEEFGFLLKDIKDRVKEAHFQLTKDKKRFWKKDDPLVTNMPLREWLLRILGYEDVETVNEKSFEDQAYHRDLVYKNLESLPGELAMKDVLLILQDLKGYINVLLMERWTDYCKTWHRKRLGIESETVFDDILKIIEGQEFDVKKFNNFFIVHSLRKIIPEQDLIKVCTNPRSDHLAVKCLRALLEQVHQRGEQKSVCELNEIWNTQICSIMDEDLLKVLDSHPDLSSVFCARNVLSICIQFYQLWCINNVVSPRSTTEWLCGLEKSIVTKWVYLAGHGKLEYRVLEFRPYRLVGISTITLAEISLWGKESTVYMPSLNGMTIARADMQGFSSTTPFGVTLGSTTLEQLVSRALSNTQVRDVNCNSPVTFYEAQTTTRNLHSAYPGFSPLVLPQPNWPVSHELECYFAIGEALFTILLRTIFPDPQCYFVSLLVFSTLLQYSEKKTDLFCVLDGPQGSGKSALLNRIQMMMGAERSTYIGENQLEKFNGMSEGKRLLMIEEIGKMKIQVWNRMKTMITEGKVIVERKGIDAKLVKNDFNFIGTNNPREGDNSLLKSSVSGRRSFFSEHRHMPLNEFCKLIKDPQFEQAFEHYGEDFYSMINGILPVTTHEISPSTRDQYLPLGHLARKLGQINIPKSIAANRIVLVDRTEPPPTDNFNLQKALPMTLVKFITRILDACPPPDKSWKGPLCLWGLVMLQYNAFGDLLKTNPILCDEENDLYGFTADELRNHLNASLLLIKDFECTQANVCADKLRTILENPKSRKISTTNFADNLDLSGVYRRYFAGNNCGFADKICRYCPDELDSSGVKVVKQANISFSRQALIDFLDPICNNQLELYLKSDLYDVEASEQRQMEALQTYIQTCEGLPKLYDDYPIRNDFLVGSMANFATNSQQSTSSQMSTDPPGKRVKESPREDDYDPYEATK